MSRLLSLIIVFQSMSFLIIAQLNTHSEIGVGFNQGVYTENLRNFSSSSKNVKSQVGYRIEFKQGIKFSEKFDFTIGLNLLNSQTVFNSCASIIGNSNPSNCNENDFTHDLRITELTAPLSLGYQISANDKWEYWISAGVEWRNLIAVKSTLDVNSSNSQFQGTGDLWFFKKGFLNSFTPSVSFATFRKLADNVDGYARISYNYLPNHFIYAGSIDGGWTQDNRVLNSSYFGLTLGLCFHYELF